MLLNTYKDRFRDLNLQDLTLYFINKKEDLLSVFGYAV